MEHDTRERTRPSDECCNELAGRPLIELARRSDLFERTVSEHCDAVAQCKRLFLPQITGPAPLPQTIETLNQTYPDAQIIFGGFGTDAVTIEKAVEKEKDTIAFIGPEGGMTDQEQKLLTDHNAVQVRLGENVLRIETAAIAFTAVLAQYR